MKMCNIALYHNYISVFLDYIELQDKLGSILIASTGVPKSESMIIEEFGWLIHRYYILETLSNMDRIQRVYVIPETYILDYVIL